MLSDLVEVLSDGASSNQFSYHHQFFLLRRSGQAALFNCAGVADRLFGLLQEVSATLFKSIVFGEASLVH